MIIDGDKYDFVENQADRNYVLDLIEDRLVTLGNLSAKQAEKLKKSAVPNKKTVALIGLQFF